jgi:phenylacetate-CoA ligase
MVTLLSSPFTNPTTREDALFAQLPKTLTAAQQATGWATILANVDTTTVTNRRALARLPVTRKGDLKDLQQADLSAALSSGNAFANLTTTPNSGLKRLFMSPGPIFDPEGRGADWWRAAPALTAAGVVAGDVIHNCFSYHFTPAAFMVEGGAQLLGCPVVPAGVGQTEQQLEALAAFKPRVYAGTPSFLRILIEKAAEAKQDISHLEIALVAGEACPPSLRKLLQDGGVNGKQRTVVQWYGTADLGCIAYETVASQETGSALDAGMVLSEDVILEIVRPGTGDVCDEGEVGEIVITNLNADYPLIRFGTGDMTKVLFADDDTYTNTRIAGWMGRADQTTKVRGMFVHPGQVATVCKKFDAIKKARLVVAGESGQDTMTLRVELSSSTEGVLHAITEAVRDTTKLRCEVEAVAIGSLPNDGKVIEDARSYA